MTVRLYEFAVILQPKLDKDGDVTEEGAIIVEPVTILARDEAQAQLIAGREIPEDQMKNLDRLTVVVRPF